MTLVYYSLSTLINLAKRELTLCQLSSWTRTQSGRTFHRIGNVSSLPWVLRAWVQTFQSCRFVWASLRSFEKKGWLFLKQAHFLDSFTCHCSTDFHSPSSQRVPSCSIYLKINKKPYQQYYQYKIINIILAEVFVMLPASSLTLIFLLPWYKTLRLLYFFPFLLLLKINFNVNSSTSDINSFLWRLDCTPESRTKLFQV